jgi:hypothetical protein
VAADLPDGYITWESTGFTIPNNSTNYTFTWSGTGIKEIDIVVAGAANKIYVDVPDVGSLSEQAALGLVPPIPRTLIVASGISRGP